jgi:hypothetical protein
MGFSRQDLVSWQGLVLCCALAALPLGAQGDRATSSNGWTGAIQPEAGQIVALANQARAAQGAGTLAWDPALGEAARRHCLRMAAEGPIAHRYGGELDLTARAAQAGAHFSLIEENVALGPDAASIHDQWMHSPGHRANLLNPEVDRVGVAVVASRGVLYAVADYARGVLAMTPAQVEAAIAGLVRVSGVAVLHDATAARAACATDRGSPGSQASQQPSFVMRWQDSDLTRLPKALVDRLTSGQFQQAEVGSCPPRDVEGSFTSYRVAVLLY